MKENTCKSFPNAQSQYYLPICIVKIQGTLGSSESLLIVSNVSICRLQRVFPRGVNIKHEAISRSDVPCCPACTTRTTEKTFSHFHMLSKRFQISASGFVSLKALCMLHCLYLFILVKTS